MIEDKREITAMWLNGSMGSVDECCERLKQLAAWDQQTIAGLRNRIKDMEDIHYKDNEIQKMKEKMEEMEHDYRQGFPLSDEQLKKIAAWQKQHIDAMHGGKLNPGVSGGNWVYEFVPTSIGTGGSCICSACRQKAIKHAFETEQDWSNLETRHNLMQLFDVACDISDWI